MTPLKTQLPKDTTAITVYIKKALLEKLNARLEGRSRNKVILRVIEKYADGETEIDWRE
jgi:metal-responsive CopG/Arc/MetJ family transcriptional regulator